MHEIQNEGDIINLIGYETILKFDFLSDSIMTFNTISPINIDGNYVNFQIEFFIEDDITSLEFFNYDSFSNFLLKYKIFRLCKINDISQDVLYKRKYDK